MGNDALALLKKDTVDVVADKIKQFQNKNELHFPANYSPENALKSAWLTLQSTVDKDKNPVLTTCTRDSIANALLDMVVQGLTPAKNQVYFIPYGKALTCQRSYFGTMAVTKRVTGAKEFFAEVVYKGDDFEFEINRGRKTVVKHKQTMESINGGEIVGAYCMIIMPDESERTEFMTMDEIRQAWKQSRMNPDAPNSTHNKFPAEMAKRTVINRACKILMNTSDDSSLVMRTFERQGDAADEAEVQQEIAENANQETIDIPYNADDDTPAEVDATQQEPEPEQESQQKQSTGSAPFL
ncbi:recombinase RecT [Alicyclobacillus sp. SO9]|uniref:recombinase RecT n=1 Tax=Alicyclobacillus sp. SO9 TaxID=2665646 RepID=UPI0018E877C1|nr:RecT family recombinase [Alicyclobacillus sp. SO9]QQE80891.1 recombinase RecT [Alicyclobacillus sp. SO9]